MSEDNFWTDELVKEFVNKFNNAMFTKSIGEYELDKFKASKTKAKDYEILSVRGKGDEDWSCDKDMFEYRLRNGWTISQVKRLSDGEIFELHKTRVVDPNTKHEWVISQMYVGRDNQVFLNGVWLNHVEKVKQPIPLFDEEKINKRIDELVAMEKGFNIAREVDSFNPKGRIEFYDGDWSEYYPYKYKTFLDYQRKNK